ncbi:sugar transferase [Glutamicibacter bergerei]
MNQCPYDSVKRGLDIVGASTSILLLSPLICVTAIAVRIKLGSPVIFVQERPGLYGKIFKLYKFRSMLEVDEKHGLFSDADRLTEFGKFLRSTSLDELPSLINVLRGDMSFVGPRPLLVEYMDYYTSEQSGRHLVRPGITGLAQVSGRNSISWGKKLSFDVEYVQRRNFLLDLEIIFGTVKTVFRRDGITQEGHVTMEKFNGTHK